MLLLTKIMGPGRLSIKLLRELIRTRSGSYVRTADLLDFDSGGIRTSVLIRQRDVITTRRQAHS